MKVIDWIMLSLTIVFFVIFVIFFSNLYLKNLVAISGPFGDTLGGTLGPALGFFSAYYVFKAFTEQRRANDLLQSDLAQQNIDSERAFQEQKRANDLLQSDIIKQNIYREIEILRKELEELSYVEVKSNYKGIVAIAEIKRLFEKQEGDIWNQHSTSLADVFAQLVSFLRKIPNIYELLQNKRLDEEDRASLKRSMNQLINHYLKNYYPVIDELKYSLGSVRSNIERYSTSYVDNSTINFYIRIYTEAKKELNFLKELNIITVEKVREGTIRDLEGAYSINAEGLKEVGNASYVIKTIDEK